jgi:imidazolonepropionase-like amidohydrolase
MLRTVFEAGGKLLVGTDMGNPFVVPGASLHDEIELLVAAGVPRAAVLRAATAGAHEFLGEPANGSVAAGARADLVLADSDPLRGPIAIPPAGVMMRGRWRDRAMLQGSLDAIPRRRVPGNTARVQT